MMEDNLKGVSGGLEGLSLVPSTAFVQDGKQISRYAKQNDLPLPLELIFLILEYVHVWHTNAVHPSKRLKLFDFALLGTVCRGWTKVVQELLVSSVTVFSDDYEILFDRYFKVLKGREDLRIFVTTLDLRSPKVCAVDPWSRTVQLLQNPPYIKYLKLRIYSRYISKRYYLPLSHMPDLELLALHLPTIPFYDGERFAFEELCPRWKQMKKLVQLHLTDVSIGEDNRKQRWTQFAIPSTSNEEAEDLSVGGSVSDTENPPNHPQFSLQSFSLHPHFGVDNATGLGASNNLQDLLRSSFETLRTLTIGFEFDPTVNNLTLQLSLFSNLECLSLLELCELIVIPAIPSLKSLHISTHHTFLGSAIEVVPSLPTLEGLRELSLSGGSLGDIPAMPSLLRLKSLHLNDCYHISPPKLGDFYSGSKSSLLQLRIANLHSVDYMPVLKAFIPKFTGGWTDEGDSSHIYNGRFCRELRIGCSSTTAREHGESLEDAATVCSIRVEKNVSLKPYLESPRILPQLLNLKYLHCGVPKPTPVDAKVIQGACDRWGLTQLDDVEAEEMWAGLRKQYLK